MVHRRLSRALNLNDQERRGRQFNLITGEKLDSQTWIGTFEPKANLIKN